MWGVRTTLVWLIWQNKLIKLTKKENFNLTLMMKDSNQMKFQKNEPKESKNRRLKRERGTNLMKVLSTNGKIWTFLKVSATQRKMPLLNK